MSADCANKARAVRLLFSVSVTERKTEERGKANSRTDGSPGERLKGGIQIKKK